MELHINLENLIGGRIIESNRIEFKKGWNPGSIYRSICAFANDFDNIGGGYIIIGIEEKNGMVIRPVIGLEDNQIDAIQREMIGLNNLIKPYYAPKVYVEEVDGRKIIILWVPGGNSRPYEVPDEIKAKEKRYQYYIRRYSNSVVPAQREKEELIALANQIPFDDRPNMFATLNDISMLLVREHLINAKSKLADRVDTIERKELFDALDLTSGPEELCFPKNISLMMFNHQPDKFFPRSFINWVEFPKGNDDPEFIERPTIKGNLPTQIHQALENMRTFVLKEKITKIQSKAESLRVWNYPYPALEEAIVNAIYHRDYQLREAVEIRIFPQSIEIINYGGPDRSIRLEDIQNGKIRNRRYRNSRIGDFLKEIELTEGKGTGIPTIKKVMKQNGSPEPLFETDDERSYFIVTLPIHKAFEKDELQVEPVNEPVNELVNEPVNEPDYMKNQVYLVIKENQGINRIQLKNILNKSISTIQRELKVLSDLNVVEFKGSDKKGGYYLKDTTPN
jgi:ATP-dependent DNA helicase RecG